MKLARLQELVRHGSISNKDATIAGIISAGLVGVLLLYVLIVQSSMSRQTDELNASIRNLAKELDDAKRLAAQEEELKAQLVNVEDLVKQFEAKLPTRTEIPRLYEGFQTAAEQAHVKVDFIKKMKETSDETLVTIPYEVSVYGNYHQLASFINRLETGARFMKISKLNIGEQKDGVSNAKFTLSTYLFKEKGS